MAAYCSAVSHAKPISGQFRGSKRESAFADSCKRRVYAWPFVKLFSLYVRTEVHVSRPKFSIQTATTENAADQVNLYIIVLYEP